VKENRFRRVGGTRLLGIRDRGAPREGGLTERGEKEKGKVTLPESGHGKKTRSTIGPASCGRSCGVERRPDCRVETAKRKGGRKKGRGRLAAC